MTPQARSLELLRKAGYVVDTCERWLTFPERKNGRPTGKTIRLRKDLYGYADIIAFRHKEFVLCQTTTTDNQAKRLAKIYAAPEAEAWLVAGGRIICHGWHKSAKSRRWECTVTEVFEHDCAL